MKIYFLIFFFIIGYVLYNNTNIIFERFSDEKDIAIIIIATNSYFLLGMRFLKQWLHYNTDNKYKFYVFTDKNILEYIPEKYHNKVEYIHTEHKSWEDSTNSKFQGIIDLYPKIKDNTESIYYFDADTSISEKFNSKWFDLGDLVSGQHYNDLYEGPKVFDRNPESKAYISEDTDRPQMYYYGAFFGGKLDNVVEMCNKLLEWQDEDKKINYEPIWNDESYLNKYFHINDHKTVMNSDFENSRQ